MLNRSVVNDDWGASPPCSAILKLLRCTRCMSAREAGGSRCDSLREHRLRPGGVVSLHACLKHRRSGCDSWSGQISMGLSSMKLGQQVFNLPNRAQIPAALHFYGSEVLGAERPTFNRQGESASLSGPTLLFPVRPRAGHPTLTRGIMVRIHGREPSAVNLVNPSGTRAAPAAARCVFRCGINRHG